MNYKLRMEKNESRESKERLNYYSVDMELKTLSNTTQYSIIQHNKTHCEVG